MFIKKHKNINLYIILSILPFLAIHKLIYSLTFKMHLKKVLAIDVATF